MNNYIDLFSEPMKEEWELDVIDPNGIELFCYENTKYLVPLYAIDNNVKTFRGNGVIVGQYLITAAHVAQSEDGQVNYNKLCFPFEKKEIIVSDVNLVFDGRGVKDVDGNHNDLIIYKLSSILGGFVFNDNALTEGAKLYSWRCNRIDDGVSFNGEVCAISSFEVKDNSGNDTWKNCFKVNFPSRIGPGNSGCGVFVKEVLYGILIEEYLYGDGAYGKVLDARYIKHCIEECENQDNKS